MPKALKAGVKFALGTDLNHGQLWLECKYFVQEIGATPMQAILAVTKNCSELLGTF
jgi:imidazolonepropionase-like amidohydrolase